ncbi:MAG: diguanylate cyclase [Deltaproteobacteria bacterium]|nr:diguanylate cyclase [Deltaproteobacteria bacterium]
MTSILIIDDSTAARDELRRALEAAGRYGQVLSARDGIEGLRVLLAEPVDAVICDLEMPGLDGEKLLAAQRARSGGEEMPFLFLTAQRDPERMARLLRAGACDIVQKPFYAAELLARLDLHLRLRRLQAELREKNATLARLSTTDPVTGLRNRRYATEFLALEVLRAVRYHTPLAVLLLDLDHFKRVNDTHGHRVGDAVLQVVADTLRATLRSTDVAGRYGGEEFLVVLPQTERAGAVALAERVRAAIEETAIDVGGPAPVSVTVSIGVAALDERTGSAEQLVERADGALYAAKDAGRNRVADGAPRRA